MKQFWQEYYVCFVMHHLRRHNDRLSHCCVVCFLFDLLIKVVITRSLLCKAVFALCNPHLFYCRLQKSGHSFYILQLVFSDKEDLIFLSSSPGDELYFLLKRKYKCLICIFLVLIFRIKIWGNNHL